MAAFGSPPVKQTLDNFRTASDSFFLKAGLLKTIQNQSNDGQALMGALEARDLARQEARDAFDLLAAAINAELTTL